MMESIGESDQMEIRQLEIFRVLAAELHFTRAAEQVHCAQSNVTSRIRALEDELRTPLFDRLGKRVTLTDSGKRIVPYVEKILSTLEEMRRVALPNSKPAGPLLIGSSESMLTYRLPKVLSRFRNLYPDVELSFRPYVHEKLLQSIESGALDLAVCMVDAIEDERLNSLRLRSERLVFVVGSSHPLSTNKKIQPRQLNGQTLLVTESGCAYRKQLDRLVFRLDLRRTSTLEFSSVEAIKQCATLGMGIALLPEIVVADDLLRNRLRILHWKELQADISTYVVWHKDKWISPALKAFIETLQLMCRSTCDSSSEVSKVRARTWPGAHT